MKLTTKGRYAVTAMLDLALHDGNGPISLAEISTRQGISLSYLEQLFGSLRKEQLVESSRGPGGGYSLAREIADISVADVINAVHEPVDATKCGGQKNCQDESPCLTHDLWEELNQQISLFLNSTTIGDLVKRKNIRDVSQRQNEKVVETSILKKGIA